jgi:release factor H-coupled RctB family protein
MEVAGLAGMVSVSAFPDLHPGKGGPVGMAAASSRLYPHLVGNDIGCGFSLFDLGIPLRKLSADRVEDRLRAADFGPRDDAADLLEAEGLARELHPASLGSIGGGNHFAEIQAVEEVFEEDGAPHRGNALLLVHSGSRSLGMATWEAALARLRDVHAGLDSGSGEAEDWLSGHDACVVWARLNRRCVAERVAGALRGEARLLLDVPHNIVVRDGELFRHYKGASRVMPGDAAPVAGSRDSLSHLVRASDKVGDADFGVAHGSGRKRDRASMHRGHGPRRSEIEALRRNRWGGRVICDDRQLLVEEQAAAYKNPRDVVQDMQDLGIANAVCSLRPVVTYKKAAENPPRGARTERRGGAR